MISLNKKQILQLIGKDEDFAEILKKTLDVTFNSHRWKELRDQDIIEWARVQSELLKNLAMGISSRNALRKELREKLESLMK